MLRHSSVSVSVGSLGSGCAQGLFEPSEHLWGKGGLILTVNSLLLPSCLGFSFALGRGVSSHGRSSATPLRPVSLSYKVNGKINADFAL